MQEITGILVRWAFALTVAFAVGFKIGDVFRNQRGRRHTPNPPDREEDFRTFHEQAMETSKDGKSRMYRLGDDNQSFELIDVQPPRHQTNS